MIASSSKVFILHLFPLGPLTTLDTGSALSLEIRFTIISMTLLRYIKDLTWQYFLLYPKVDRTVIINFITKTENFSKFTNIIRIAKNKFVDFHSNPLRTIYPRPHLPRLQTSLLSVLDIPLFFFLFHLCPQILTKVFVLWYDGVHSFNFLKSSMYTIITNSSLPTYIW